MADIDVEFATNADIAAAQIDGAEKATTKAAQAADKFTVSQERLSSTTGKVVSSTSFAVKALRGVGLAAGLAGAEFGGAIGKVAGLATAGASVGGPWGAAIGAGIGLASVAVKEFGSSAEETTAKLIEMMEATEKFEKSKADANKTAADEGQGLNKKHGPEIRRAIAEGRNPFADPSKEVQQLMQKGMSREDAEAKASAMENYRKNPGVLSPRIPDVIKPGDKGYDTIQNLDALDKKASDKEFNEKINLASGQYSEATAQQTNVFLSEILMQLQFMNGRSAKTDYVIPKSSGGSIAIP